MEIVAGRRYLARLNFAGRIPKGLYPVSVKRVGVMDLGSKVPIALISVHVPGVQDAYTVSLGYDAFICEIPTPEDDDG